MRLTDFESRRVDELAPATLASYKKKAGAAATAADAAGDVKTANKRFSGIVKATKKQFDQDAKGVSEGSSDTVYSGAEELNIGDPVIITGNVEFEGTTGNIIAFGQDKRFVVVNLYNHGKHSFHSSDVSFNEYAGSDEEEARMYDTDPDARAHGVNEQGVAEGQGPSEAERLDHYHDLKANGMDSDTAEEEAYGTDDWYTDSLDEQDPIARMMEIAGVPMAEDSVLDRARQSVQSQGFTDSPEERNADRLERKRRHNAALDRISRISGLGSEEEAKHLAQQRMARDAYDTQRRKDDDEDTRKTFDMFRDRLNRMQYKNQRDVDPEQLAKISAIKYVPIREAENFHGRTPPGYYDAMFDPNGNHIRPGMLTKPTPGVDAKGRTQSQWIQLVKAKFPDGKMIQAKMPDGPVQVILPDGRKLGWKKVEQAVAEGKDNPYGYHKGQTVKLNNGQQGRVIDIFDDSIEVLLVGGRTVTVDFRDAQVISEQGVAEGRQIDEVFADQGSGSTDRDNADYMKRRRAAKNTAARGSVTKKPQPYNDPNWIDKLSKEQLDALAGRNRNKDKKDVAEADLDKFKKYTRTVIKTTPKIERTTNPAGRTTDHVEWRVTTPTGEIHRYKSKKQAQEHFDSFDHQGVSEGKADYNFDIEDLKRLERIRDLPTLKTQAMMLISKPSAKPMRPEKVEWFKNALERMTSPMAVIKLMYDLLLSGEGHAVVGSKSSMTPNHYRQRFNEQGVTEAAQGHTIEAHGVRGMDRRTWHKTFKNTDQMIAWAEKHDAEIVGTRDLEQARHHNLSPAQQGVAEDSLAAMRRLAGIVPQVPLIVPNGQRQYRHMPTAVQPR